MIPLIKNPLTRNVSHDRVWQEFMSRNIKTTKQDRREENLILRF